MKVFYSQEYVSAGYSFDTTRKAQWIADSLGKEPIEGVELCVPESLSEGELSLVHANRYVNAIRTGNPRDLAQSQGFRWDEQLWPMVLSSNGGVVEAVKTALVEGAAGSLSSGLHHAKRDHGEGFCTFNGVVVAAHAAKAKGAASVLIIDLDAHCGGGTHSLIRDHKGIWHLDVAVAAYDRYDASGQHTLDVIREWHDYLPTITARLYALSKLAPHFDLCIYEAGMDPEDRCDTGGLKGINSSILAEREELVFGWCERRNIPIAFVLAGGYKGDRLDVAGLVDLHRLTIETASRYRLRAAAPRVRVE